MPHAPGVKLHHIMTVNLSAGTIDHVVNGVGDPADTTKIGVPVYIDGLPGRVDTPAPRHHSRWAHRDRRDEPICVSMKVAFTHSGARGTMPPGR